MCMTSNKAESNLISAAFPAPCAGDGRVEWGHQPALQHCPLAGSQIPQRKLSIGGTSRHKPYTVPNAARVPMTAPAWGKQQPCAQSFSCWTPQEKQNSNVSSNFIHCL